MADNNITQDNKKNEEQIQNSSEFRGAAIHIKKDSTLSVELVGITLMELYGALDLIFTRVKKQLNASKG